MRKKTTKVYIGLLTILALVSILISITQTPANCWDKYKTERDAIMHCEEH